MPQEDFDAAMSEQLARFARRVAGDDITVTFKEGVALIEGRVASSTQERALTDLIGRVHREYGRTVLMVEHHLEVVLDLVDRVAVLHHGQLLACDRPHLVVANPEVQAAYLGQPV